MAESWGEDAQKKLFEAFNVRSLQAVQDILNCMLLSESVYKAYESGPEAAAQAFRDFQKGFAPGLITVHSLQCSLPHVQQRYLVAASEDALYVAFMGTKAARDFLSDANYVQAAVWPGLTLPGLAEAVPTAHQGFLGRAQNVPAEQLYAHAQRSSRRLVFCGHSLGGAVAKLCTLRLLQQLQQEGAAAHVMCVSFAAPPLGNAALADVIAARGWNGHFYNLTLPEDFVPRLLAMRYSASLPAAAVEALTGAEATPAPEQEGEKPGDLPRGTWGQAGGLGGPEDADNGRQEQHSLPWRSRLTSGLDRLRALAAHQQQPREPHAHAAGLQEAQHAEESSKHMRSSSSNGGTSLQALASTASRYLPIYVHFGSQHQLPALRGALSQPAEQTDAEGEEGAHILAALQQEQPPLGSDAAGAGQGPAAESGSSSGGGAAAARRRARLLMHHRMYAIRERGAAACAAAAALDGLAAHAHAGRPVRLSGDVAPQLHVMGATARLPPLPPRTEPTLYAAELPGGWAQWGWSGLARALPAWPLSAASAADGSPGQSRTKEQPEAAETGLSAPGETWWRRGSATAASQQPATQLEHHQGPQESSQPSEHSSSAPWLPRLSWRPWEAGGAPAAGSAGTEQPSADSDSQYRPPSPGRDRGLWQRGWLPGWASTSGASPADGQLLAARSSRVQIVATGRGLAGCSSARVQVPGSSFFAAKVIRAPAPPPLHMPEGDQQAKGGSAALQPAAAHAHSSVLAQAVSKWQGASMRLGMRLAERARQVAGWQRQAAEIAQSQPAAEEPLEEMVLEAVLPHAALRSLAEGLAPGASALEVQLRSDFHRRRAQAQLMLPAAWVLSDSGTACAALLHGLGGSMQPGATAVVQDNVRFSCAAGAAGNPGLTVVTQLVAQVLAPDSAAQGPPAGAAQQSCKSRMEQPGPKSLRERLRAAADAVLAVRAAEGGLGLPLALTRTLSSAQSSMGGALRGLRSRVSLLRHRALRQTLLAQQRPELLVLCLSESAGSEGLPHCADLAHAARAASVPLLIVLLHGAAAARPPVVLPAGLRAAAASVIVLSRSQAGISAAEAMQLRRAAFHILSGAQQPSIIQSRL